MLNLHRQRGAAAVVVASVLAFVLLLVVAFAQRNVLVEQRIAANQQRAVQAFEAAEAGVAWALARLDDPRPAGPNCRAAVAGTSFRERYTSAAGLAAALQPACVRDGDSWRCACPPDGDVGSLVGSGDARAAFRVDLRLGEGSGTLRVISTGCAGAPAACEATARSETVVGWLPPIVRLPHAALTARGSIDAPTASFGAHHANPASGGLTLHAGGTIAAAAARLTPPAGSLRAESVFAGDAALAAAGSERLFATLFGMPLDAWRAQATRVDCSAGGGDCSALVAHTLAATGAQALWIDGDLEIAAGVSLGTPQRPVLLAAAGAIRLRGDVAVHGLLFGRSLDWRAGTGPAARIHGATVIDGDVALDASADFVHDAALLGRLQQQAARPVAAPGSWRDF
jgi:hypothetical protein